jgi:hypothetical protein
MSAFDGAGCFLRLVPHYLFLEAMNADGRTVLKLCSLEVGLLSEPHGGSHRNRGSGKPQAVPSYGSFVTC